MERFNIDHLNEVLSKEMYRITITNLDVNLVILFKTQCFGNSTLFRLQVKHTQVSPMDGALLYLRPVTKPAVFTKPTQHKPPMRVNVSKVFIPT